MSARSLSAAGGAPSFTLGAPAPGDDGKSVVYVEATKSTTMAVPALATTATTAAFADAVGTNVKGTIIFTTTTGTGTFPAQAFEAIVIPSANGNKLISIRFAGSTTTAGGGAPISGTPTTFVGTLPASLSNIVGQTLATVTGIGDTSGSRIVACTILGVNVYLEALVGGGFADGDATMLAFSATYTTSLAPEFAREEYWPIV